jgi:predicted glycosyltransferase
MSSQTCEPSQRLAKDLRHRFLGQSLSTDPPVADIRVVLYSHDTMGIGHMRRNLLIASKIKSVFPNASILTVAGAKEACGFAQTAGIDCLTLPAYQKRLDGTYESRSLGVPAEEVLNIRSQTILAAIKGYRPDLFIVDKLPAGAGGELLPTLDWLQQNSGCRCVLGLRDILDASDKVIRDWQNAYSFQIIREHFQSVWIYGDQNVYDAVQEYKFPADIAERVTYTGYLDTRSRLLNQPPIALPLKKPFVLCTVGGGQDGEELATSFVEAIRATGRIGLLLTGPHMPEPAKQRIQVRAKDVPSLQVLEFFNEGDYLVQAASHVVSMGGYNTLSAILSHGKKALIVPRVTPRKEQMIRADRLALLGHVQTIHPDKLSDNSIAQWLSESNGKCNAPASPLDIQGLVRICEQIHQEFPTVRVRV